MVPVSDHNKTEWLKKKSQEELYALLKRGNPQDVIPYATALTSQLNQVSIEHYGWLLQTLSEVSSFKCLLI